MLHDLLLGPIAGAVGTATLKLTTYADIIFWIRPASQVPAHFAERLSV